MAYDLSLPSDPNLAPGEARCPGPSTRDLILLDQDNTPPPLLVQSYQFLGDADIPFDRYYSKEMFAREIDHMWTRTWQWACREEHIPNSGDYYVYDVGPYSFVVIRTQDGDIKAYYNACLHRGMQLCEPHSQGTGKQFIRCPFHGIAWHLNGELKEVPCRWDFPHIKDEDFKLPEVRVATWGGFVFINMDENAPPLAEFLEALPEHFKYWPLQDRYISLHVTKILPSNWKMAMEAFLEAFHVLATHPQGLKSAGDANAQYDVFGKNVTRFIHTIGHPSPHLPVPPTQDEMLQLLGGRRPGVAAGVGDNAAKVDGDALPAGVLARSVVVEGMRENLSAAFGVDLSKVSTSEMMDSIEYWLFPNMCLFPGISLPMIYRFRPNGMDVDSCIHEILFLTPVPKDKPRPPPAKAYRLAEEDSFTTVPGFSEGLAGVFDQDTANLRRQRDGVKASRKRGQTLGNYQEVRIRRFHMTLDEYLSTP